MFFFNKKKEEPPKPAPVKKDIPLPPPAKPLDADDFFKDMGRKPKVKEVKFDIETPEVTGLREEPLPPPGSTIKNAAQVDTDGLADKSGFDDSFIHGNIRLIKTEDMDIDSELARARAEREQRLAAKAIERNGADAFFADIDKRKLKNDIAVPEVTGLRESPAPAPFIDIRDARQVDTDSLPDKSGFDNSFVHGDINAVDISTIDTSVLDR